MVYIMLEENGDKFLTKYQKMPKSVRKIVFKSKCRNGKFKIEKIGNIEYIVLPILNDKVIRKLKNMAKIRCWKNVCVSNNLRENGDFIDFAKESSLKIMDGKWLFRNMTNKIVEYIADVKNEPLAGQEISILCKKLDETVANMIKEISAKVKICNIVTDNIKQYQRLEEQVYQKNGIILNVSNNYKRVLVKSSMIINFDFLAEDLENLVFPKNEYIVNMVSETVPQKKDFGGRNIVFCEIEMPGKYIKYQEIFGGVDSFILYESLIYKNTNCKNIQKELLEDNVEVLCLKEANGKIIKKSNIAVNVV